MSSVSSATSSPYINLFPTGSSTTSAILDSTSSTTDTLQQQTANSAINEVEQIPDQLKQQAHNWATQELTHLLNVLRVTLVADPSAAGSLKDLAKGISSDAKQIAGQGPESSQVNSFTPLVTSGQSGQSASGTEIDISVSFSQSITAQNDDSNSSNDVYFQSDDESIGVQVEVNSVDGDLQTSPEGYSHDVTLLSQASVAVGQIKAALQKALQNAHSNQNKQDVDGAGNDISDSLNSLIGDAVNVLLASPAGSLTGNIPGSFSLTA